VSGTKVTAATKVTRNVTVYARWEKAKVWHEAWDQTVLVREAWDEDVTIEHPAEGEKGHWVSYTVILLAKITNYDTGAYINAGEIKFIMPDEEKLYNEFVRNTLVNGSGTDEWDTFTSTQRKEWVIDDPGTPAWTETKTVRHPAEYQTVHHKGYWE
jgi:hypothetical protein